MSRYIDAELVPIMADLFTDEQDKIHRKYFIEALSLIPTADVIEMRHGHWTYEPISYTPDGIVGYTEDRYKCSVCNGLAKENGKFCTNCAAIMDEEAK